MAVVNSVDADTARAVSALWWLWVMQAIFALLFGLVAVFWPGLTLVVLVYLLGAFVIGIGLLEVVRGLMNVRTHDTWWMSLIMGLLLLGAGVYLARHPSVSLATLIVVIGITFIVWGVVTAVRAFMDNPAGSHKVLSLVAGVAGVAVGVYTLFQPVSGGVAFVWAYGVYALIFGITSLVMAVEHHRDFTALRG